MITKHLAEKTYQCPYCTHIIQSGEYFYAKNIDHDDFNPKEDVWCADCENNFQKDTL